MTSMPKFQIALLIRGSFELDLVKEHQKRIQGLHHSNILNAT